MELKFSNDLDSAKRLDEIMNSYSGRDRGSIMADERSLAVVLTLLEHGKIVVTEHTYPYDPDIQGDREIMEVYSELARETRWQQFRYTQVEGIRLNALRQMRQEGKPSYDGEFISYRQTERFHLFTYPYWTEDRTAKYYRFDLSETAITGAGIYRESVWNQLLKASEDSGIVFPTIPHLENDPPTS